MIYLIFKSINPATRISISNIKDEIEKQTIAKFGNNVIDILDDMSSNYSIILDQGELHEYYVRLGLYFQVQTQLPIVLLKGLKMIGTQE